MKQTVTINLDKERHLFFGLKAMRLIQEKTGKNPYQEEFWKGIDANSVNAVMWSGLLHEDKNLTIEQVEELVDEHITIGDAINKFVEAYQLAIKEGAAADPLAKKHG